MGLFDRIKTKRNNNEESEGLTSKSSKMGNGTTATGNRSKRLPRGKIPDDRKEFFKFDQKGTARLLELLIKSNLNLQQSMRCLEGILQDTIVMDKNGKVVKALLQQSTRPKSR